ncbi:THAP-type domain-containing protein [Aphis craccivora]|uniref:THAP-type domain-containing protein n=1 Tax=Aphis craccivora TaxID=307492 RepID=A0A6G0W2R3_APHCR|nr:THAP-type domain-containing protein [Aphis craccivora]
MKVRFASQVFSATVAAGMRTCIKCNTLPIAADTTVNFIDNMDKLFDILNSKPKADGKEFNLPFKNNPKQKNHLIIMLNIFKNMRVIETKSVNGITTNVDVKQRIKLINGWQITIKSLLQLWDDIQKPQYFLCTNRLNQDCL